MHLLSPYRGDLHFSQEFKGASVKNLICFLIPNLLKELHETVYYAYWKLKAYAGQLTILYLQATTGLPMCFICRSFAYLFLCTCECKAQVKSYSEAQWTGRRWMHYQNPCKERCKERRDTEIELQGRQVRVVISENNLNLFNFSVIFTQWSVALQQGWLTDY